MFTRALKLEIYESLILFKTNSNLICDFGFSKLNHPVKP